MDELHSDSSEDAAPITTLERGLRRVLGALLEKAFTTPDSYPLTLKALTTACNQKNNRDPVTNYSEDQVIEYTEQLQSLGLVAELHTDGGRAPKYRHLARKRFNFTEPQLAILTELWLRGRQQLGELRTRASRMVPIETLEDLRAALQPLLASGQVQANGPLERRGIDVDHGFYPPTEARAAWAPAAAQEAGDDRGEHRAETSRSAGQSGLEERCAKLEARVSELESRLERLEQQLDSLLH